MKKKAERFLKILMEQPLPKFEQTFKDKKLVASLLSIEEYEIEEDFPCRIVNCGNPFFDSSNSNFNLGFKNLN